jgi:hypothetical protein
MITLTWQMPGTIEDIEAPIQHAINLEFSTLRPYLYALMAIPPGENAAAGPSPHLATIAGSHPSPGRQAA